MGCDIPALTSVRPFLCIFFFFPSNFSAEHQVRYLSLDEALDSVAFRVVGLCYEFRVPHRLDRNHRLC